MNSPIKMTNKHKKKPGLMDLAKVTDCLSSWGLRFCAPVLLLVWGSSSWAGPKQYDFRLFINEAHPFESFSNLKSPTEGITPLREREFLSDTEPKSVRPSKVRKARNSSLGSPSARRSNKLEKKIIANRGDLQPGRTVEAGGRRFQFGAGYFDVTDDWDAAEFRAEWHGNVAYKNLRPLGGFMATSNGAYYGFAGLIADFELSDRFIFSPSFAPGIYVKGGSAKKLGHWIEFRSMAELSYKLDSGARFGIAIYHLSNASLDDFNPGTEVISFSYTVPMK